MGRKRLPFKRITISATVLKELDDKVLKEGWKYRDLIEFAIKFKIAENGECLYPDNRLLDQLRMNKDSLLNGNTQGIKQTD